MTTCNANGMPRPNAMCGRVGVGTNRCSAEPNSCEFQSDYKPPEYKTLRLISAGVDDYFPNAHLIKLMQVDLIVAGKPGFELTEAGQRVLQETTKSPKLKRVECEGVGDNDGFFEFNPKESTGETK